MAHEKQTVDLIVKNAHVVTFDDRGTIIADGAIAIDGNSIAWIGPSSECRELFAGRATLDAAGKISMPGFID